MPIGKNSKWLVIYLYLKSLEAVGFKSFAEKVMVNFQRGVIAVVGPNGSGKSNITDAIRWVLGEQSTRYLRASAMQDIIFSGTQLRKPANLAQVSLVFDNSDQSLPLDYKEIEITRRLYRNGESEYSINKKGCRLKDVHNLFLDTGVGKGSLFVIGQNKVDEILNGKADEKRVLIEDIAGIVKYKLKKQESLQRLDKVQEDLLRLCDIKIQNENSIQTLAQDAENTEKYNELYQQLKLNSVQEYLYRYENLQKNIEELAAKYQEQNINKQQNILEIQKLEEQQANNNISLEKIDAEYAVMQTIITDLATNCEKIVGNSSLLRERQNQLKNKIIELDNRQEKLIADHDRYNNINLINLQKDKNYKRQELQKILEIHEKSSKEYQQINLVYSEKQAAYKKLQEDLNTGLNEYLNKKNQILYLQKNIEQIKTRIIRKEQEVAAEQERETSALLRFKTQQSELKAAEIRQITIKKEISEKISSKNVVKVQIDDLSVQFTKLEQQLQKTINQNIVLERLHAAYQGFASGTKSVLAAKTNWRAGIIGAVVETLKVPKEYIVAIETALGNSMQNIITKDDSIAKQAVVYLKDNKAGRVTFLPLNTISAQKLLDTKILQETSVIGTADSLVKCKQELQIVANFLLARVIVVDNIDNALKIAKKYNFRYRLVTLNGEVLNVGGSLTGGSFKNNEPSFLSREEEIAQNKIQISKIETEKSAVQTELNSKIQVLNAIEKELQSAYNIGQQLAITYSKQQAEVEYLREKNQTLSKEVANVLATIVRDQEELNQLTLQVQELEVVVAGLESTKDSGKYDLTNQEIELTTFQDRREASLKIVNDLEIQKNSIQQEIKYLQEKILYTQEDIEKITIERSEIMNLIQKNQSAEAQLLQEIKEVDKQQQQEEIKIAEQKRSNSAIALQRESLQSEQINIQTRLREKNLAQSNLERAASKAELNLAEKNIQVETLISSLQEKFSMDLVEAEVLKDEHLDIKACRKNIQRLQTELQELGLINPRAIEDYENALEKLEFMKKQYQDLLESKENLNLIIVDLDKAMTERFKEAFKDLNAEFSKTYKNLFAGGSARLELLEAEDWLNSGVEIFVQPIGKKQQALSLLSGGERSLTVIALLFAILSLRKTSFCVLDEIDAPLDEANLHRFNRYLQEYGSNTQFIIVTHRKPSMQIANTIYGVTMQEPGISKVLSVQIKDLEAKE